MRDFIELLVDDRDATAITVNINHIVWIRAGTIKLSTGEDYKLLSKSLDKLYDKINE